MDETWIPGENHWPVASHWQTLSHNVVSSTGLGIMVFNATFNNISVILWWSVSLVEETAVPKENHQPSASHWQTYHTMLYIEYTSPWMGFELTTLVVIGTDCIGNCKSNYHTITSMTPPKRSSYQDLIQYRLAIDLIFKSHCLSCKNPLCLFTDFEGCSRYHLGVSWQNKIIQFNSSVITSNF